MPVSTKSSQQRPVTCNIDDPGNPSRVFIYLTKCGPSEFDFRILSRNIDTVPDIRCRFLVVKGREVISKCNSLTQLSKLMGIQDFAEFRLADQDDLKQFFLAGFQIRQ